MAAAAWGEMRAVASSSSRALPKRRNSASVRKRSRLWARYFWAERQGFAISLTTPQAAAWSIRRDSVATTRLAMAGTVAQRVLQVGDVAPPN